ncbi:MAG: ATP synthase subunit I [Saprospiraceae bacterium]|nr:ATP synthase subunit I [Pyrinomonadaceae bacterium]
MSDDLEPVVAEQQQPIMPISHGRILVIMAVLAVLGSIAGFVFVSAKFGIGVLIGGILAFVNYYWLKVSLKKVFDNAAANGEKPRLLALKYFTRYLVLGCIIAIFYATDAVSIVGLILGMAGFGFAVVIEGFFRIFTGVFSSKEI